MKMKNISDYIQEGFFGNLGIDTPGNIRRIFDDLSRLPKDHPAVFGFMNPNTGSKYGYTFRYGEYYIALKYDTCQMIIHNGTQKTNRNDMVINMTDFPELVKNLANGKVTGFSISDRTTLSQASYENQKRKFGPSVSIINFRCEGAPDREWYRIKYDRSQHTAYNMD